MRSEGSLEDFILLLSGGFFLAIKPRKKQSLISARFDMWNYENIYSLSNKIDWTVIISQKVEMIFVLRRSYNCKYVDTMGIYPSCTGREPGQRRYILMGIVAWPLIDDKLTRTRA